MNVMFCNDLYMSSITEVRGAVDRVQPPVNPPSIPKVLSRAVPTAHAESACAARDPPVPTAAQCRPPAPRVIRPSSMAVPLPSAARPIPTALPSSSLVVPPPPPASTLSVPPPSPHPKTPSVEGVGVSKGKGRGGKGEGPYHLQFASEMPAWAFGKGGGKDGTYDRWGGQYVHGGYIYDGVFYMFLTEHFGNYSSIC